VEGEEEQYGDDEGEPFFHIMLLEGYQVAG